MLASDKGMGAIDNKMRARNLLTLITYNAAISACTKGGQKWEKALALFNQMREHGITADVITYNAAISACAIYRKWEQAFALVFNNIYYIF